MVLFGAVAAALLVLAMAMLWRGLRRGSAPAAPGVSNLTLLKAQLRQLDQELADGAIDAAQHRSARTEIERRVLDEESVASTPQHAGSPRATQWALLLAVPLLALGLYALLGNPAALTPHARSAASEPTREQVDAMVAQLAERMDKQPPGNVADTEGWVMLGRSYSMLQRYPEASRAFARALELMPGNPQILVDQADVLAMQRGGDLQGEPLRLIEQALRHDPTNLKALALAGTAAFDRKDFAAAVRYWTQARSSAGAQDNEFTRSLDRSIAEARAAGGSAPPAAAASAAAPSTAGAQAGISGRVSVAPALAARVAPDDTVFVFARAVDGPRAPLAILKRRGADLPLQFTLDDSMAMSPELKLSGFADVVVTARVSKGGDAMPRSGDLEGQTAPLGGRNRGIELSIDRVRP